MSLERTVGADRAAAVQEGPAVADPAPAEVAIDRAPGHRAAQHLDRGAEVVFLALPGEDHRCRAPRLGHPVHGRIAFRRHTRGRQPPAVGHASPSITNTVRCSAPSSRTSSATIRAVKLQSGRRPAVARFLAPGDHAVAGHEVGAGLDRRIGCRGVRSAFDDPQAGAAHLPLEVPHADAGLLELADGPLIARRVILPGRGERAQRVAFERCARVGCGASERCIAQRGFAVDRRRLGKHLRLSQRLASSSAGLERLAAAIPAPNRLGAVAAQHVQPVDVLARLAGQRDPDLEALVMGEGEGAGCPLAGTIAAVVVWPVFIPVGRDRDRAASRARSEGPDAAGRQSRGNRESPASISARCASASAAAVSMPSATSRCGASPDRPTARRTRQRSGPPSAAPTSSGRADVRPGRRRGRLCRRRPARRRCDARDAGHPAPSCRTPRKGSARPGVASSAFAAGGS